MTQEQEIKLAESKGFTCLPDERRGDGWKQFAKNNLYVWYILSCGCSKWQTAFKNTDNYFVDHITFDTLEEALNRS